ncbi:MAG: hypothetical protein ABIJ08_04740 [Nanoarchaeota archaeon]
MDRIKLWLDFLDEIDGLVQKKKAENAANVTAANLEVDNYENNR